MPNWCENEVTIDFADKNEYEWFLKLIGELEEGSQSKLFDTLVPTPSVMLENGDWWGWRIESWGTKWNPEIHSVNRNDEALQIGLGMTTAWSPPREFFMKLTELFPSATVELIYLEEGLGFCGKSTFQKGVDINERYINDIPNEMYAAVGYVLDDEGNVDWEADADTESLWNILGDDDEFTKYLNLANGVRK